MRKTQLKFMCDKDNAAMPRVKRNCVFACKQSQQPVSPVTMFSTILFHLLSVEIKQRKVANRESKQPQKLSTVLSQVTLKHTLWSSQVVKQCKQWAGPFRKNGSVPTGEGTAFIIFQKLFFIHYWSEWIKENIIIIISIQCVPYVCVSSVCWFCTGNFGLSTSQSLCRI